MEIKDISKVRRLLCELTGIDCNQCNNNFFVGSISKRVKELHLNSIDEYFYVLKDNSEEIDGLISKLSVDVSRFFSDFNRYKALKNYILPEMIAKKTSEESYEIKIWSAGCSTGEEPYSIAMVLSEVLGSDIEKWDIGVYATDINDSYLDEARAGRYHYSKFSEEDMNFYYMQKYFNFIEDSFIVRPVIRSLVNFSNTNLILDTPFINVDVVFCRDVLTYMIPEVRNKILVNLHKALNDYGFLFLGSSESMEDYFLCYYKKLKKYREVVYRKVTHGNEYQKEKTRRSIDISSGMKYKDEFGT